MRPARRAAVVPAGLLATGMLLAGCTGMSGTPETPPVEIERTPTTAVEAPADVDPDGLRVPIQVEGVELVDPGWDTPPQSADGVALGLGRRDGALRFTAVAADGSALWSAGRPVSCTGYAVTTTSDGRALAVLTDTVAPDGDGSAGDTAGAVAATSATAYDLETGAEVWGPVRVPGPLVGPGLVFAAPSPEPVGASGPPVVLDAETGEPVTPDADVSVLGEYRGTVLTLEGSELVATATHDGAERWRVETAVHGWDPEAVEAATDPAPAPGTARLRTGEASEALVDLTDGSVLADGFTDVGVDTALDVAVSVDDAELRGTGADGEALWTASTGQETTVEGVSGALAYLRVGESLRVHNAVTGKVAEAYDPDGTGDLVVPVDVTDAGSIVLSDYSRYLLATTETAEDTAGEGTGTPAP